MFSGYDIRCNAIPMAGFCALHESERTLSDLLCRASASIKGNLLYGQAERNVVVVVHAVVGVVVVVVTCNSFPAGHARRAYKQLNHNGFRHLLADDDDGHATGTL